MSPKLGNVQILTSTLIWIVSFCGSQAIIPIRERFISKEAFCFSIQETGYYNIKSALDSLRVEEVPIIIVNDTDVIFTAHTIYLSHTLTETNNGTRKITFFDWFDLYKITLLIINDVYPNLEIKTDGVSLSLTNELVIEEYDNAKPLFELYNFADGRVSTIDLPYFNELVFSYGPNNTLQININGSFYWNYTNFVLFSIQHDVRIGSNTSGKIILAMKRRCEDVCKTFRSRNLQNSDLYTSEANDSIASRHISENKGPLLLYISPSHTIGDTAFNLTIAEDAILELELYLNVFNAPGYYYQIPSSIVNMLITVCHNQSYCLDISHFYLRGNVTLFHRWDKELVVVEKYGDEAIARHIGKVNETISNLVFNTSANSQDANNIKIAVILKKCGNSTYPLQNELQIQPTIHQDSICLIKQSGDYNLQFGGAKKSISIDINERDLGIEILKTANYSLIGSALKDKIGAHDTLFIFREIDVLEYIELGSAFSDHYVTLSRSEERITFEFKNSSLSISEIIKVKTVNLGTKEVSTLNLTLTSNSNRIANIYVSIDGIATDQELFHNSIEEYSYPNAVITEIIYNSQNVALKYNEDYSMNLALGLECSY